MKTIIALTALIVSTTPAHADVASDVRAALAAACDSALSPVEKPDEIAELKDEIAALRKELAGSRCRCPRPVTAAPAPTPVVLPSARVIRTSPAVVWPAQQCVGNQCYRR